MKLIILILLITLLLVSCTPQMAKPPAKEEKEPDLDEKYNVKELIPDGNFSDGMTVLSQKDHKNGDRITELGSFTYTDSTQKPKWSLAQWDSGPCIWRKRADSDSNTLTDGVSKWVTYNPDKKSLLLRLNTEAYYNATPRDGDWVRAAQLYMYFGARNKDTGRFVWFGLQIFDSRWEKSSDSYFVDGGKADASGQMIYVIGMEDVYKNMDKTLWDSSGIAPQASNEWLHYEIDLIPHLQAMVNRGIDEGDFEPDSTIEDFYIDYMNYGWEIIATYDCGVEIKNLSLKSCIEK